MSSAKKAFLEYRIQIDKPYSAINAYFILSNHQHDPIKTSEFFQMMREFPLQRYGTVAFRKPFLRALVFKTIRIGNLGLFRHLASELEPNEVSVISAYLEQQNFAHTKFYKEILDNLAGWVLIVDPAFVKRIKETQDEFIKIHHVRDFDCDVFASRFDELHSTGLVDINVFRQPNVYRTTFGLHRAIECNNIDLVDRMIRNGADPSVLNRLKFSDERVIVYCTVRPTTAALLYDNESLFKHLFDNGLEVFPRELYVSGNLFPAKASRAKFRMLLYGKVPSSRLKLEMFNTLALEITAGPTSVVLGMFEFWLGTTWSCDTYQELQSLLTQEQKGTLFRILTKAQHHERPLAVRKTLVELATTSRHNSALVDFLLDLGFNHNAGLLQ